MKFTLGRNKTITSNKGHTVSFEKDVAVHVPPEMHEEVMAIGAMPEEEIPEPVKTGREIPESEADRKAAIMPVLEAILLRNDRDDFTATGAPKVEVVSAGAGFRVSDRERSTFWEELKKGVEE